MYCAGIVVHNDVDKKQLTEEQLLLKTDCKEEEETTREVVGDRKSTITSSYHSLTHSLKHSVDSSCGQITSQASKEG